VIDGHPHTAWRDKNGRVVVERHDIIGLGHGTPLSTRGSEACGTPGPFMLEAGICSTRHIARRWGLLDGIAERRPVSTESPQPPRPASRPAASGPARIIDDALRAAGLLR
jgi:hypothetical protein